MTTSAIVTGKITDPSHMDAEIERHRSKAQDELGGPVELLKREHTYDIAISTEWTRKPEPPKEEPAPEA